MTGITLSLTSVSYFAFILLLIPLYYLVKRERQWQVLLLASMLFFTIVSGVRSIPWILLQWLVTYGGAQLMERVAGNRQKKLIVTFLVFFMLGELFLLKYTKGLSFVAPIAISFYSLSVLSYVLDVYWGISPAEKNPLRYLLFVCFFPQMTSGPVTRYREMAPQFASGVAFDERTVKKGLIRIVYGVMKKCLIADQAAVMVNTIFGDTATYQGCYVAIGAMLFALQLYTDFSGCMDIILGTSECFGITLPENFILPFSSVTMAEFWRRWHITLGVWFKEYLMYPLLKSAPMQRLHTACVGRFGRKKGKKIPTYLGLLVVWFLIGYWHGGAMHYVIGSGLLHYFYIVSGELLEPHIEKWTHKIGIDRTKGWYVSLRRLKVFLLVCTGFVFFRSESARQGFQMLCRMLLPTEGGFLRTVSVTGLGLSAAGMGMMLVGCVVLWSVSYLQQKGIRVRDRLLSQPVLLRYVCYVALTLLTVLAMVRGYGNDVTNFIYNRF